MLYGANYATTEDGGVIFTLKIDNYVAPSSDSSSEAVKKVVNTGIK